MKHSPAQGKCCIIAVSLLVDLYDYHVGLCYESCSSAHFQCGHYHSDYTQTSHPFFVRPSLLIGTIGFYYFILLSLILTLPRVTRSTQRKNSWLHFSHIVELIRMKFKMALNQFKFNIMRQLIKLGQ